MPDIQKKSPSIAVIRRMPKYYLTLLKLKKKGEHRTSSGALAKKLSLTASQVRQDFNCFGGFGQQGYGYNIDDLISNIEKILGIHKSKSAIVIGVGNLGLAVMHNFNFDLCNIQVAAAFDVKESLIGTDIAGIPVMHIDGLTEYLKKHSPDIAVLTLPGKEASSIAVTLRDGGIRGVWNFTSSDLLRYIPDVPVENVRFDESLMVLSYALANKPVVKVKSKG